jgi:hypothetical protein
MTMMDGAPLKVKRVVWAIGVVGAFFTALIAVANAGRVFEPYWIATRGHVHERVAAATSEIAGQVAAVNDRLDQQTLDGKRFERARVQDKIADRDLLLRQEPNMNANARVAIEEQLRVYRETVEALTRDILRLENARSGR